MKGEFEAMPNENTAPVRVERRGNRGLLVATIVFALATVGLGVALAIVLLGQQSDNKVASDKETSSKETSIDNPEDENNGNVGDDTSTAVKATRTGYSVIGTCSQAYLTKSGDLYIRGDKDIAECGQWGDDSYYANYVNGIASINNDFAKGGQYSVNWDDLGEYGENGATEEKESFSGIKVNVGSVITAVVPVFSGQNWTGDEYVIVKEDGSADILRITTAEGSQKVVAYLQKNIGGYKNIASAIASDSGSWRSVTLITKNGGQIHITDKIKH